MPSGGNAGAGRFGEEEYEQFLEIRRHVKRMQVGTPLLLRIGGAAASGPGGAGGGQEDLRICTFWVTKDLQTLCWHEQENDGPVQEVPLSAIADVVEDTSRQGEDEEHHALTVVLRPGKGAGKQVPGVMGLICASPEDLASWHYGLKFLAGSLPPPQSPSAAKSGTAANASPAPVNNNAQVVLEQGAAGTAQPQEPALRSAEDSEQDDKLRQSLREATEANEKLKKENDLLREVVKQKDAAIAMLLRDLQSRSTMGERCGKTESTSRESDEHLSYREAAILRRKNRRLQKAVRAKQQTVTELLQLVGRVTAQQNAESSAVEDAEEDDESSQTADGASRASRPRSSNSVAGALGSLGVCPRGSMTPGSSDPEAVREEMLALSGKLERIERAAEGQARARSIAFQPPPRELQALAAAAAAGTAAGPATSAVVAPAMAAPAAEGGSRSGDVATEDAQPTPASLSSEPAAARSQATARMGAAATAAAAVAQAPPSPVVAQRQDAPAAATAAPAAAAAPAKPAAGGGPAEQLLQLAASRMAASAALAGASGAGAVAGAAASPGPSPSPATAVRSAAAGSPASPSATAAGPSAVQNKAAAARAPGAGGADTGAGGGGGAAAAAAAGHLGGKAAMEALARELRMLEEKKRTVEQLAKSLEPPSDAEEDDDDDDGFPLR